jgi:hypothetical protein
LIQEVGIGWKSSRRRRKWNKSHIVWWPEEGDVAGDSEERERGGDAREEERGTGEEEDRDQKKKT